MQSRFRGFSVPREQAKETYSGSIRRLRFAGTTRRIAPKGLPKREPEYDEPRRKGKEPHPAQTGSALLTKGLQNLPHSFGKECIRKGFQNEGQPECTEKKLNSMRSSLQEVDETKFPCRKSRGSCKATCTSTG